MLPSQAAEDQASNPRSWQPALSKVTLSVNLLLFTGTDMYSHAQFSMRKREREREHFFANKLQSNGEIDGNTCCKQMMILLLKKNSCKSSILLITCVCIPIIAVVLCMQTLLNAID